MKKQMLPILSIVIIIFCLTGIAQADLKDGLAYGKIPEIVENNTMIMINRGKTKRLYIKNNTNNPFLIVIRVVDGFKFFQSGQKLIEYYDGDEMLVKKEDGLKGIDIRRGNYDVFYIFQDEPNILYIGESFTITDDHISRDIEINEKKEDGKDLRLFNKEEEAQLRNTTNIKIIKSQKDQKKKAQKKQEIGDSSKLKIMDVLLFEGINQRNYNGRVYAASFLKETTRRIWIELKVENLFRKDVHKHTVVWVWYNLDGSEMGRVESPFIIKPDWKTSRIERGWGWIIPGNWEKGTYDVKLIVDDQEIKKNFTIL